MFMKNYDILDSLCTIETDTYHGQIARSLAQILIFVLARKNKYEMMYVHLPRNVQVHTEI